MKLYGALDVAFALVYAYFGFVLAPSRWLPFSIALGVVIALLALAGVGLLAGARWARRAAIVASALLLAFAACVIAGLVASSAYLAAVYGALGRGMSIVALLIAALVIEFFALLPIFQLRFLLRRSS